MNVVPKRGVALSPGANVAAARVLARSLCREGADVFVSPGSRNTPLAIAFDELPCGHDDVALHVVLDERVAAFAALGASRARRRPAVLVCTSGSAAGHYLPAIMEASESRVPLIVVTADRPPELHHCGAPQTIAQQQLFTGYVRWSADLALPRDDDRDLRWLAAMGARARMAATGSPAGPVHLNAPFRKPLLDAPERAVREASDGVTVFRGRQQLDETTLEMLAERLRGESAGVVYCGPRRSGLTDDDAFAPALARLAACLGWPLVADGTSGVADVERVVCHADALCRAEVMPRASRVLRFGGAPTNKAVDAWLATIPESVIVDPDGGYLDPHATSDTVVVAEAVALCTMLADALGPASGPSAWMERWQALDDAAAVALDDALPFACAAIAAANAVSSAERVHVASSMAVRDYDVVSRRTTQATSNRGVNGIDGTIATALGIALATEEQVTVLCGDLAFAHDIGGLLAACQTTATLTVVVVNNGGGGIFEMLPISTEIARTQFERLFATPQQLDVSAWARAAGADYAATTGEGIQDELARAGGGVTVIELREEREQEVARRARMWRQVTEALRRAAS